MVTAGTYRKNHLFQSADRLEYLQQALLESAAGFGWEMQGWAVFSNHYHFIALAPRNAETLRDVIRRTHSLTARRVNAEDAELGRKVWHQYWDTCLTYDKSYWARMNYVHHNPVHHNLVLRPEDYRYCSARWLFQSEDASIRRKIESFNYDGVKVPDDF